MKRLKILLMITIVVSFSLAGCNGRRELNELLIVSALGIDISKSGKTEVHIQVLNPNGATGNQGGAVSGGSGGSVYTYSVKGSTIYEGIDKAGRILPRYMMFSHINSVVIGEKYARKKGLKPLFDFMERNHEFRETVPMFIAKHSTAKEILTIYTPIFKNPGESLNNRLQLSSLTTGLSEGVLEKDVVRWRFGEHRDPAIPGVEVLESSKKASDISNLNNIRANDKTFLITGLALFDKDRLKSWLTAEESKGWAMISGRTKEISVFTQKCGNKKGHLALVAKEIKTSVKPIVKGDNVFFSIEVNGKGYLQEVTCNVNLGDPAELRVIEKFLAKVLKKEVVSAVKKAQKEKTDVFGFGQLLYEDDPDYWKRKKNDWPENFAAAKIKAEVKIKLETTGARIETINQEK
ncbi:Ger(x)C family spore germination protein [Fictibacillus sp. KIGAM418]|uniref:Ger(X)C family spore germination protein n=1 Tax=Fictibacillus marinisediminis TaxID=2878389 RepID=A0A9X1XCM4_9BACL|nr:Ger(x)C family spore germination protein [Fictibacillus marinisediminis]MCK6256575.1 Ger(x)C family spore germination protein [Fictibacillus marinisediminis]